MVLCCFVIMGNAAGRCRSRGSMFMRMFVHRGVGNNALMVCWHCRHCKAVWVDPKPLPRPGVTGSARQPPPPSGPAWAVALYGVTE